MIFARLSFGTKLVIAFGITLVFMVAVAGIGILGMASVKDDMAQIVEVENKKVALANATIDSANAHQIAMRNLLISEDRDFCEKQKATIDKAQKDMPAYMGQLAKLVITTEGKQLLASIDEIMAASKDVNNKVIALGLENRNREAGKLLLEEAGPLGDKTLAVMEQLIRHEDEQTALMAHKAQANYSLSRLVMIGASALAVAIAGILAFFLTRSITRPIRRVTEGLAGGADQVSAASNQVASGSQSLAEGTAEQAASIEEASSSLEEISSMTRQNAQTANNANRIMQETSKVVTSASESMSQLTSSMVEISSASEETQKIVKTIDEISFQTNLLALNAAVEAARAGEAGAGFAVVADEVRNLAMRAADAAKNTADLIEGTVKKIKEGSEVVAQTNSEFSKVVTSSARIGELVGEIAAASQEQAQGIEQISKGISEMDKVVQRNAASAEESASASEEMNA